MRRAADTPLSSGLRESRTRDVQYPSIVHSGVYMNIWSVFASLYSLFILITLRICRRHNTIAASLSVHVRLWVAQHDHTNFVSIGLSPVYIITNTCSLYNAPRTLLDSLCRRETYHLFEYRYRLSSNLPVRPSVQCLPLTVD